MEIHFSLVACLTIKLWTYLSQKSFKQANSRKSLRASQLALIGLCELVILLFLYFPQKWLHKSLPMQSPRKWLAMITTTNKQIELYHHHPKYGMARQTWNLPKELCAASCKKHVIYNLLGGIKVCSKTIKSQTIFAPFLLQISIYINYCFTKHSTFWYGICSMLEEWTIWNSNFRLQI